MPRRGVNRSTALRLRTTARRLDGLLDAADQASPREGAGGLKRDVPATTAPWRVSACIWQHLTTGQRVHPLSPVRLLCLLCWKAVMDAVIIVVDDKMARRMFAAIGSVAREAEPYASVEQFVDCVCGPEALGAVARVEVGLGSGIELASYLAALACPFPITFLERQRVQSGCIVYLQKPVATDLLFDAMVDAAVSASELGQSIERPMLLPRSRAPARKAA